MIKKSEFIGKLVFIIPMAYFGFIHLGNANKMAQVVPDVFPMPVLWVILTGMGLVLACVAIIIGIRARLGAQLLAAMLFVFAVMIHLPPGLGGNEKEMFAFFQNLSLSGGALYLSSHLQN